MSRVDRDGRAIRTRNRPPIQQNPQDVSAEITSSTLPVGAATETTLATIAAIQATQQDSLDSLVTSLSELVELARGGFEPSEPTLPFLVGAS